MKEIPNDSLSLSDVPPRSAEWSTVEQFAYTFNGYRAVGFDACAELANRRREPASLTDLRAALFFEARRYHHFGYSPDEAKMEAIHGILDQIRARLKSRGPQ